MSSRPNPEPSELAMQRVKHTALGAALAAPLALLAACGSTKVGDDVEQINSIETITAQEWQTFGQTMLKSMRDTGVLGRYQGPNGEAVVMVIGDFQNKSSNPRISNEKTIFYNEIRKVLVNSGEVEVNMDVAGTGGSVDTVLQQISTLLADPEYDAATLTVGEARIPALVLYGEFIDVQYSQGRTTQVDYAAAVKLLDTRKKASVWEDQIVLPKQRTKGIFGG
ncbi:MAG TPA: hypothetical protein VJP77_01835 [Planctomycetota bacterium]|nr:hypothetical protein [Planctomycetota bacterium]